MPDQGANANMVSSTIRKRRTAKVLANSGHWIEYDESVVNLMNEEVQLAIEDAGYAPFHYHRNAEGVGEPWRFHVIRYEHCRVLSSKLADWYPDMKPGNKLPSMLAACGCLVLVNWLPQFGWSSEDKKQIQVDEEHLAATAAAVQNFLLSLTARGLKTYWSSGGFFRLESMFTRLGISTTEKLLAAVFVDYGANEGVEIVSGKQHEARSNSSTWTNFVRQVSEV